MSKDGVRAMVNLPGPTAASTSDHSRTVKSTELVSSSTRMVLRCKVSGRMTSGSSGSMSKNLANPRKRSEPNLSLKSNMV